jgi:hypothetical protein
MQKRFLRWLVAAPLVFGLATCATQPVDQSRQALWQRFANHPIDEVVLAWGAPQSETRLTDGTRVLTYRRTRTLWRDFGYGNLNYGDTVECDASFLAPPPDFKVKNISMDGDAFQCADMARGASGVASPPS